MSAPQCDHRSGSLRGRNGRRCTKRARYHASIKNGEGGGNFCQRHGEDRAKPGVKLERLPALGRCSCTGGDVPHGFAAVHVTRDRRHGVAREHSRCTRSASTQLRRIVTTEGKVNISSAAFAYCEQCAQAIEAYQGSQVERVAC